MYQKRFYRDYMEAEGLVKFNVTEYESDLEIISKSDLKNEATIELNKYRGEVSDYIKSCPEFLTSLVPVNPAEDAPAIVKHMCRASRAAGVGPMAAVAGAISEYVGKALEKYSDEIIIENGGDIYINSSRERHVLVYAGKSPLSNKIALLFPPSENSIGVCTSSGTVGHSLSFGKADAAVLVSHDTLLADAAATAVGNRVKTPDDIQAGIDFARSIPGVEGVLIIIKDKMGVWGNITLTRP